MPWPSTRTTTGWREALIAAFSAAGVRPVGLGTVCTRGSSRDQLGGDLVGAVRGRAEGDHDLHLAGVLLREDVRGPSSRRCRSSLRTGMITETAGSCTSGIGVHRDGSRYRERGTPARAGRVACPGRRSYGPTVLHDPPSGRRPEVPPVAHAAAVPPCPRRRTHARSAARGRARPDARPPRRPAPAEAALGPCGRSTTAVGAGARLRRASGTRWSPAWTRTSTGSTRSRT